MYFLHSPYHSHSSPLSTHNLHPLPVPFPDPKNLQSGEILPKKTVLKYTNISGNKDDPTFLKNTKFNESKFSNK